MIQRLNKPIGGGNEGMRRRVPTQHGKCSSAFSHIPGGQRLLQVL
jgi:hypothetical protein